MSEELLSQIRESLMKGKADDVKNLAQQAIDAEIPVEKILEEGMIKAMSIIGEKFKKNEVYVPEMLIAARAMNAGMEIIKPRLVEADIKPKGTICIGTVKGDLHDIGKNLVGMMLEGGGYKVIDLGVNVEAEKFVSSAKENEAEVVAMSALLTTTMGAMKDTVQKLLSENVSAKTIVGGAPLTDSFAKEIGADGYAPDAASAVDTVASMLAG